MSGRVWTVEKLTEMHPVGGWTWHVIGERLRLVHDETRMIVGWTDGRVWAVRDRPCTPAEEIPADAAMAVILASKGLDSMEVMAQHMVDCAMGAHAMAEHESDAFREHMACAEVYRFVADMLRRGTVKL